MCKLNSRCSSMVIPRYLYASVLFSPGAKLENGGLPYTESPLSFDGFN